MLPVVEAQSLNHWTACVIILGEVLLVSFLGKKAEGWKDGLTKTTDPRCVRTMSPAPVF